MVYFINLAYVRVHINTHVRERDIVRVMVQFVMVNIPNVIARLIILGAVVLVLAEVILSIVVVEQAIVPAVERRVGANIRVVIVPHIIVGMVMRVLIHTHMFVQAGIKSLIQE